MIDFIEIKSRQAVDEAVGRLIQSRHFIAGSIVSMPVIYPSGSTVTVEVTMQNGRCFVSDMGGGHHEAEMLGAARYFKAEAERIAEASGIRFDGRDVFVAEVPPDNLNGALVVVANASAGATAASALRLAERADKDAGDMLFDRLSSIFRTKDVQKDVKLVGASNHQWRVSVLVLDRQTQAMFEPVSGNYTNAVGTTAKFHDFARVKNPPARFAVVKSREDLKDFYGLVAAASTKVVQMSEPDATFAKLLESA